MSLLEEATKRNKQQLVQAVYSLNDKELFAQKLKTAGFNDILFLLFAFFHWLIIWAR